MQSRGEGTCIQRRWYRDGVGSRHKISGVSADMVSE